MNVYNDRQESGIQWPCQMPAFVYEPLHAVAHLHTPDQRARVFESLERQLSQFSTQHADSLTDLQKHYVLPPDSSLADFLTQHRTIPQILLEAAPQLRTYFGPNTIFHLRAPIDELGSRTIYAVVMWPNKSMDVRDALAKFDAEWWLERAGQAAGNLTFTYELT